jgi:hypothetical protein
MPGDESILTVVGSTCLGDVLLLKEVCLYNTYLALNKRNSVLIFQNVAFSMFIIVAWMIMLECFIY